MVGRTEMLAMYKRFPTSQSTSDIAVLFHSAKQGITLSTADQKQ